MRKVTTYLIVKADGSLRLRSKRPARSTLGLDEVAVPIVVTLPDGWGSVLDDQIDIHLPDVPSIEPDEPIVFDDESEDAGDDDER